MIKLSPINNKKVWEKFIENYSGHKTFLQSWDFGQILKEEGYPIWRFAILNKKGIVGIIFLYKISAKRGTFLYAPHGPLINENELTERTKNTLIKSSILSIIKFCQQQKVDFVRINSLLPNTITNISLFKEIGFKNAPLFVFTENFWLVDISKSEEELLKNMRKVHRYSIRKAIKDGVTIVTSQKPSSLNGFYKIYLETAKRHKFTPYNYSFLKNEFKIFARNNQVLLFFSRYQNTNLSAAMIIFYQNTAYYHHGGSLSIFSKIPASYLLHWEIIQEAKKRGCTSYNMWGIAPPNKTNHPWQGLTFFKTGFGGSYYECLPTQDYPLTKKYWLNYLIEKVRKYKRGYA